MQPTEEQQRVLDAFATGDNVTIKAGAGTGKTTTLKLLAKSTRDRGVYVAYNKAIADEAAAKFPSNVQCQPPGTLVRVPVKQTGAGPSYSMGWRDVPIESLRDGDHVVSFSTQHSGGFLRKKGQPITVASREYDGRLVTIEAAGFSSRYTDDHHCLVWLGDSFADKHVLYLMRRGDQYRVGRVRGRSINGRSGLSGRIKDQQPDAVWILDVLDSAEEAAEEERWTQHNLRVPGWLFRDKGQPANERLWEKLGPNADEAQKCLAWYHRKIEYPLWQTGEVLRLGNRWHTIRACNLVNGMRVVTATDNIDPVRSKVRAQDAVPIRVTHTWYSGLVYSLDVETDHTYVADGIVTHNCRTAHSFAFRAVGHEYSERLSGGSFQPLWKVAKFLGLHESLSAGTRTLSYTTLARLVSEMVDNFCNSADREIRPGHRPYVDGLVTYDDAGNVEHDYHHELGKLLLPYAEKSWENLLKADDVDSVLRFKHDHYLKIWQLNDPVISADYILFDEAQDANPVIASIIQQQDNQIIPVGDDAQAIYAWRGAINALDSFDAHHVCYLSQSFRFGQAIADVANTWLEKLDTPLRLTGTPEIDSKVDILATPRALLCRSNAGALNALLGYQANSVKAHLVGGAQDIGRFCNAVLELQTTGKTSHRDLIAFTSWDEVVQYVKDDKKGAGDLATWVGILDRYGVEAVRNAIANQHPHEDTAEVTISTAHKAKGREWTTVRIGDDFAPKTDKVTGDPIEPTPAEVMLNYVAVTRAMNVLDAGPLTPKGVWSDEPGDNIDPSADEGAVTGPGTTYDPALAGE